MKRMTVIIISAFVVLTVAAVYFFSGSEPQQVAVDAEGPTAKVPAITLPEHLPAGQKEAQALLTKAKKELTKLMPKEQYVVVDCHRNKVILRTQDSVLLEAGASTGSGGELVDSATGQKWIFNTPRGVFKIKTKLNEPWWRKPDWAFIEDGEEIPKDPSERLDPHVMGDYAIGFGDDGYFIHGTIYERLLGVNVTHGCVRVGSEDLKKLYTRVRIGEYVYIL